MAPPKLGRADGPHELSVPLSLFLDAVVYSFRAVAPLSVLALAFELFRRFHSKRPAPWWRQLFRAWVLSEVLFLLYCKLVLLTRFQAQPPQDKVAKMTSEERKQLFLRCLDNSTSPEVFVESWFLTNTRFSELTRENVREFLAWGMFHVHDWRTMSSDELLELEDMVEELASRCKSQSLCDSGYNANATLMKFTEQPVTHTHRPLAMYVLMHHVIQEVVAPLRLSLWFGFTRKQCGNLSYHVLRGKHHAELPPIVFCHGIGVGLLPYDAVIADLCEKTGNAQSPLHGRTLILIELHATSQRLAPPELFRDDFVAEIRAIFALERITPRGGMFLGHSYGSFAVAWVCQRAPELVAGTGLLDPVCVYLHHPHALYSILYKEPENAAERATHFIVRAELNWNFHVRRHFFWYANILFLESCEKTWPILVVLSEDDVVVPVAAGRRYVEKYVEENKEAHEVNLVHLPDCEHGGFLYRAQHRQRVIAGVEWIANKS